MVKPTFVIAPGGWHVPWHWSLVEDALRKSGFKASTVRHPSIRDIPPYATSYHDDRAAVASALLKEVDDGHDIILVMHSYGGIPGSAACKGLSKAERKKQSLKGGIVGLVYIASFALDQGVSLGDFNIKDFGWYTDYGEYVAVNDPPKSFYHDVPEPLRSQATEKLQRFSSSSQLARQDYAAWKDIPSTYIICERDVALLPQAQEFFTAQDGVYGGKWDVVRMETGHSPFLAKPGETADILKGVAEKLCAEA